MPVPERRRESPASASASSYSSSRRRLRHAGVDEPSTHGWDLYKQTTADTTSTSASLSVCVSPLYRSCNVCLRFRRQEQDEILRLTFSIGSQFVLRLYSAACAAW